VFQNLINSRTNSSKEKNKKSETDLKASSEALNEQLKEQKSNATEVKRQKYFNKIKKQQLYLSESISIKKLN